ncbi:MAG: hypothetical protein ABSF69_21890 [Polyangiaceae bacterium]
MNDRSRDDLAREANRVRAKLLDTVEQLDRRRHDALDLGHQIRVHLRQIAMVSGVVAVALVATVGIAAHRFAAAPARRRRDRWQLLVSLWKHPRRVLRSERPSLGSEVLRSMGLSLIHWVVSAPVRRWVIHRVEFPKALAAPPPNRRAGPET